MSSGEIPRSDASAESEGYPSAFVSAMVEATTAVGWQVRHVHANSLECACPDGDTRHVQFEHVYKRFLKHDPTEWPTLAADYVQQVVALSTNTSDDLQSQSEQIVVRLGMPFAPLPGLSLWTRPVENTNLVVMLVLEMEEGLRFVSNDMVEDSGRPGEEWFAVGMENLRRRTLPGSLRILETESGLMGCNLGDAHDASRALLVESLLPEPAPHGVLLSVPQRDALLVLPLNRLAKQPRSLALLKRFTQQEHDRAQYPVSPETFWIKDGTWYPFDIDVGEDRVRIGPPRERAAEFQEWLDEE